jgi:RNA polymerase sigma factor (TIGR02999 family)
MSEGLEHNREDVTRLIGNHVDADAAAAEQLFAVVYDELHGLAARKLRRERANHTLCPTELVHEAYLRLSQQRVGAWKDRAHFFSIAARIIRRILVDHARARNAKKRGGDVEREELSTIVDARAIHSKFHQLDILALEEALKQLAVKSPARAQVVELRFFAGITVAETAELMGVQPITVKRHWKFAQAWLLSRM